MRSDPAMTPEKASAWTGHHRAVWIAVGLSALLGIAYTLLVPPLRAPDELTHLDMVRRHQSHRGFDEPDRMVPIAEAVRELDRLIDSRRERPRPPLLAEDAVPRHDRPSFDDLAPLGVDSVAQNHMTQHPPAYYAAIAAVTTAISSITPSGLWSWDREFELYRLLSVLLTAPLPLFASIGARATGLGPRSGAVAAAATLLGPQATAIGAAINNDALVMVGAAAAVSFSLRYLAHRDPPDAWIATAAAALAALTKATAAPILAWTAMLVLLVALGRPFNRQTAQAITGSAVALALGASWYVRNLARFGDPQVSGLPRPPTTPSVAEASRWTFSHQWAERASWTYWGQPARRTGVAIPWQMAHGLSAFAVALGIAALFDRHRRKYAVALGFLVVGQTLVMVNRNWSAYERAGVVLAVQGRYLFGLLVPIAVLMTIGAREIVRRLVPSYSPRLNEAAVWGLLSAGTGLHLLLAGSMLANFWGAADATFWQRLDAVVAWSPFPALVTRSILGATVVSVAALVVCTIIAAMPPRRRSRNVTDTSSARAGTS